MNLQWYRRPRLVILNPDSAALDAARAIEQNRIGAVVVQDKGRVVGIVTDRDLAVRVMAAGKDPHACNVAEIMTRSPRTIGEDAPIEDALKEMSHLGVRRMIVVDADDRLAGIVSLDDMLSLVGEEIGRIGQLLDRQGAAAIPEPHAAKS